jgi:hypothetical protein
VGYTQLDSAYVDELKGLTAVQTFTAVRSVPFIINSRLDNSPGTAESALFVPNTQILQGFGFSWKFITLKFSVRTPLTFLEKSRFGKSEFRNFALNLNGKNFHVDFSIRRNRGFSDLNQEKYDPNWYAGKSYFHRWDTKVFQMSANSILFFSQKYSHNALFNFKGKQLKTAGSFLIQLTGRHQRLLSDSVLIAAPMAEAFGRWGSLKEARTTLIGIMPGYSRAWVKRNWFFSPYMSAGPALQLNRHFNANGVRGSVALAPVVDGKFSVGYNSVKFFTGVTGFVEYNFDFLDDLFHMTYYNGISWHIGFRF